MQRGLATRMHFEEIKSHLTSYFKEAIRRKSLRMAETGHLSSNELERFQSGVAYGTDSFQLELKDSPHLTSFFDWTGIKVDDGSKEHRLITLEYERAYSEYCQHILDLNQSLGKYDFGSAAKNLPLTVGSGGAGHELNGIINEFCIEQHNEGLWKGKTEGEKRQHFALLIEMLPKNIRIEDIAGDHARHVKSTLQRYPRNRHVSPKTRGLSLEDALAVDTQKLATKTINEYLQSYNSFFMWARKQSYIDRNYFEAIAIKAKKKSKKDGRQPFSQEQYEVMLREIIQNSRGLIKKPYQKWGPLIAMYTGARLNEIAQLELADIKTKEGIDYFDFNDDADDKSLKTEASARAVPIHSKLISLGLMSHIDLLRSEKVTRLFPDFPHSKNNGYGRNLGRWVNEVFLVKLDMKTVQHSFHSFRHTISNDLLRQDIALQMVQAILGHEQQGVTLRHYSSLGFTLKQLSDVLEKFKW